jgi:hypothetical protein
MGNAMSPAVDDPLALHQAMPGLPLLTSEPMHMAGLHEEQPGGLPSSLALNQGQLQQEQQGTNMPMPAALPIQPAGQAQQPLMSQVINPAAATAPAAAPVVQVLQAAQVAQVQAQTLQVQAHAHAQKHAEVTAQAQSLQVHAQAIAHAQLETKQRMLNLKAQVANIKVGQTGAGACMTCALQHCTCYAFVPRNCWLDDSASLRCLVTCQVSW